MNISKRIWKPIVLLIIGLIYYFAPNQNALTQKNVALIIMGASALFLFDELMILRKIKKAKRPERFKFYGEKVIADYLERKGVKYIYNPQEEKQMSFLLPEFDIYVKFWDKSHNQMDKKRLKKRCKDYELKLIEIQYGNIFKDMEWAFTNEMLKNLRKR